MITERRLFWLFVVAGLLGLVYLLANIITPFVVCLVLAYILDPLTDALEEKGFGRTISAFLVCAGSLGVLFMLFLFLLPVLISQIASLAKALPELLVWLQARIDHFFATPSPALDWVLEQFALDDSGDVQQKLTNEVKKAFRDFGSTLFQDTSVLLKGIEKYIGAISSSLSMLLLVPFILFYLLRDWDRMVMSLVDILPRSQVTSARILGLRCHEALKGFFRGQLLVVVFLGLFYGAFLAIIGVPFGFLIGLFTGLFSFIPYVGMLVGFTIAEIVTFVHFGSWQEPLMVLGVFIAGQVIESSVLTPKLIGDSINLHPVWIIFGLLAGGSLMGFAGLVLAIPTLAILGVLVRFFLERYQSSDLYEDH